jgi:hypothetical protein
LAALSGPGILWVFYELYRFARRRVVLRRQRGAMDPAWNSKIVRRRQYHRDNNELVELSVLRYKK